jgi:aldehyde:ferredoxin oxidoreductase
MAGGYMGKVLFVDLSAGTLKEEALDENIYRDFLGGYGIGARVLYSRQKPGVDALGPENTLGMVAGLLTGTPVPTGARYQVVGKSPLTGGWGDANSGGQFGPYLKFAGFDGVFFTGISPKPVYLLLDNGRAELKDAGQLWGKDAYETEDSLTAEYGKDSRVACIGPAGERMSLIASIMTDRGSAAGRSGLGAVMGSKKLKAVVARGTMAVPMVDKDTVDKLRAESIKAIQTPGPGGGSFMENWHKYGTSGIAYSSAHSGDSPVRNWGGVGVVDLPDREGLQRDVVASHVTRLAGCWHCPIACKAYMKEGSEYKYAAGSRRPEYETLASFGSNCGNSNTESINMANDICNRAGLDTISAGSVIAFAIECFENGVLTKADTDGIDLKWGNHQALVQMTEKLAKAEGLGAILSEGVKAAAEKIGRGAEKFAVHAGGQEPGMHDPRLVSPRGGFTVSQYQMDATPGRHTANFGPGSFRNHFLNATGLCQFGFGFGQSPAVDARWAGFVSAVTGWEWTPKDLVTSGERIANIRQAFNLREGINPLQSYVHDRMLGKPPLTAGPLAGVTPPATAQIYWNLGALDWDRVTTKPSKAKLLSLGLNDVAADLWPDQPPPGPR